MMDTGIGIGSIRFTGLWVGSAASGIATWALPFVLGFAVTSGDLSATAIGTALAVRTLGFLGAVPLGGVLSDRWGSRQVILVSSGVAAVGTLLSTASIGSPGMGVWWFMAGMVLSGAGQGACRPAYQAIVPLLVQSKSLQAANATLSLSVRATNLAGPAVAALIASAFGLRAALLAVLVLWLLSAVTPPWPPKTSPTAHRGRRDEAVLTIVAHDLRDAMSEAVRHPWFVAGLGALTAVVGVGYSVTTVLLPEVSESAHGGASLLAAATTALLLGALAGGAALTFWQPPARGWLALAGLGAYGLVPLSLMAADSFWLPVLVYFAAGFGLELFNVIWFTAFQQEVPQDKLARVSSLDFLVSYGLSPLGLFVIAPITVAIGMAPVLLGASLVCFSATACACLVRSTSEFRVSGEK